ncbi:MAG: hypothetical protein VB934_02380 [Polyangiaceae bacterium]
MNDWRWGGGILVGFLFLACGSGETTTTSTSTSTSSVSAGGSGQGGMTSSSMSVTSTVSSATGGAGGAVSSGSGGTGGSGGQSGNTCMWSDNSNPCPMGEYCDAPGCGQGTCKTLGTTQNAAKQAVCGCDGINYWSDEIAAVHGMSVANSGVCMPQEFCGGIAALKCPDPSSQHCVFDVVNATGCLTSDVPGWCWVLPTMCPSLAALKKHRRCDQEQCDSECDAMKSGQRYYAAANCK